MKLLSLSTLIFLGSVLFGQHYEWSQSFGANFSDVGRDVYIDPFGNLWIVGNYYGTIDFDYGAGVAYHSAYHEDGFILKTDANGNYLWSGSIGAINTDWYSDICGDYLGNIYLTGRVQTSADLDPGSGVFNYSCAGNDDDFFVEKLDNNGNLIWVKTFGGFGDDRANDIEMDQDGNLIITGGFSGAVDFDPGAGVHNLVGTGYIEFFALKLNPDGDFIWAKSLGGDFGEEGYGIAIDHNNDILITGYFMDTVDFAPLEAGDIHISEGNEDVFILKLDEDGNFIWARTFGGMGPDFGEDIAVDSDNNIYPVGRYSFLVDIDPGSGVHNLPSSFGSEEGFIQKLDSNGNFVWAASLVSNTVDICERIQIDTNNQIYILGEFGYGADFDPGTGIHTLPSNGQWDIFVQKLDTAGNYIWARSFGGTETEYSWGLTIDNGGSIYITGTFQSTVDFDPESGIANHSATGTSQDLFILKLMDVCLPFDSEISLSGNDFTCLNNESQYQWITCKDNQPVLGATSQFYTATESQSYAVIVTFEGCVDTSDCLLFNDVSILENEVSGLQIYPNPSNARVQINLQEYFISPIFLWVTDLEGQIVYREQISGQQIIELDLSSFAKGIYTVSILNDSTIESASLFVE